MRDRRLAIEVINVNGVRGELVESLLEDPVGARWTNVDIDDEETATATRFARGVLFGVVVGAACWLVIIAVSYLILTAHS